MFRRALKAAAPKLHELADELDVSYDMLRRYAGADRDPPPALVKRLAVWLRKRARRLEREAGALERAGRSPPSKGGRRGKT